MRKILFSLGMAYDFSCGIFIFGLYNIEVISLYSELWSVLIIKVYWILLDTLNQMLIQLVLLISWCSTSQRLIIDSLTILVPQRWIPLIILHGPFKVLLIGYARSFVSVFIWEIGWGFSCTILFCLWCESNTSLIKSIWKWFLLSSFWKNLKRVDISILDVCYNLPLKPCGPGLFLFGGILIANSTSLLVIGYSGFPWFFFLIETRKSRNLLICSTLFNLLTYALHSSFFFFLSLIQNAKLVFLRGKKFSIWFCMCVIFSIFCFICISSGTYYFFPIDIFKLQFILFLIPWGIELVYLRHSKLPY